MLILMLMLFLAVLPLFTGIYYAATGYARKSRNTLLTGLILIAVWALIMYYVSGSLYTLYTTTE